MLAWNYHSWFEDFIRDRKFNPAPPFFLQLERGQIAKKRFSIENLIPILKSRIFQDRFSRSMFVLSLGPLGMSLLQSRQIMTDFRLSSSGRHLFFQAYDSKLSRFCDHLALESANNYGLEAYGMTMFAESNESSAEAESCRKISEFLQREQNACFKNFRISTERAKRLFQIFGILQARKRHINV